MRKINLENPEYASEKKLKDLPFNIKTFPRWILLVIIRFYQAVISPGLSADTCRFYPSCSHYTYQAIYRYGAFKGTLLGTWRVLRCNPINQGGYDPVPEDFHLIKLKLIPKTEE
jgi:putative membrane protein insertion efficiency factor